MKSKVKKTMSWALFYVAHMLALYGAFVLNKDGSLYILKFFVWAFTPVMLIGLMDESIRMTAAEPPADAVIVGMDRIKSWLTLGLLVWFGHIVTALAWCVVMVASVIRGNLVRKARAEQVSTPERSST